MKQMPNHSPKSKETIRKDSLATAKKWQARAQEYYFYLNGDSSIFLDDIYCRTLTEALAADQMAKSIYKAIYHMNRNNGTWEDVQAIMNALENRDIMTYHEELAKAGNNV